MVAVLEEADIPVRPVAYCWMAFGLEELHWLPGRDWWMAIRLAEQHLVLHRQSKKHAAGGRVAHVADLNSQTGSVGSPVAEVRSLWHLSHPL